MRLTHFQFIEKMARYKPIHDFQHAQLVPWKEVGERFELTPTHAWHAVDYYKRHLSDPQQPALATEDHDCVRELGKLFDLSSQASIKTGLCAKFKAEPADGKMNYKHAVRKSMLIKVMKASGLKWFELNGTAYIHWSEKA